MDDGLELLRKFAARIMNLPPGGPRDEDLTHFVLAEEQRRNLLQVVYAPFDWINESARVAIVGITPGRDSMTAAFREATAALQQGRPLEEVAMRAKRAGSFSNMRRNLAEMLDALGVPAALRITSSASLFGNDGPDRHLLHTSSVVRYPVFVDGENYTGHSPKLLKSPVLLRFIEEVLAPELRRLTGALIVPCGEAVSAALCYLAAKGLVDQNQCLMGFPHASGENGHRKKFFEQRKQALRLTVDRWESAAR